jgi:hypothetical protein
MVLKVIGRLENAMSELNDGLGGDVGSGCLMEIFAAAMPFKA